MVRTQISFDEDLYRRARAEARRRKTSLAELCRRGLRAALADARTADGYMGLLGALASGDPRASETIDEVVYGREEP